MNVYNVDKIKIDKNVKKHHN